MKIVVPPPSPSVELLAGVARVSLGFSFLAGSGFGFGFDFDFCSPPPLGADCVVSVVLVSAAPLTVGESTDAPAPCFGFATTSLPAAFGTLGRYSSPDGAAIAVETTASKQIKLAASPSSVDLSRVVNGGLIRRRY